MVRRGRTHSRGDGCPGDDRLDPRIDERVAGDEVTLRLRPQRLAAVPLLFFAAVWNVYLVGWLQIALDRPGPWGIAIWLPLLHGLVGLVVAWEAAHALVGRVEVRLGRGRLDVRARPLPRPGAVRMPSAAIAGFDVRAHAPSPLVFRAEMDGGPRHRLVAVDRDGQAHPLPISLADEGRTRALASRLAAHLETLRTPRGYRG